MVKKKKNIIENLYFDCDNFCTVHNINDEGSFVFLFISFFLTAEYQNDEQKMSH